MLFLSLLSHYKAAFLNYQTIGGLSCSDFAQFEMGGKPIYSFIYFYFILWCKMKVFFFFTRKLKVKKNNTIKVEWFIVEYHIKFNSKILPR